MTEILLGILMLGLAAAVVLGSVMGIVALVLAVRSRGELRGLARRVEDLADDVRATTAQPKAAPESAAVPPTESAKPPAPEAAASVAYKVRRLLQPREPPPPASGTGRDWARLEEALGKRWMTWAGALALFFAVAFTVKYAFERGWIGPPARVVLGIAAGLAMLVGGDFAVRRAMRVFGQGLMGGGLAMLYAALYAAFSLYQLVPQPVAFGAMVLVTAAGMTLAVRHDAVAMSFLAVLGGVLTPVLLSTGVDARDSLFTYLLLLDLGVVGVALFKRWRALDVLAFVGTAALFAGWFVQFYQTPAMVPTMLWLGAFYVVFLILPFLHHLRHGEPLPPERITLALANAMLTLACAYAVLRPEHKAALGTVALVMAACYLALATLMRRRIPGDVPGLLATTALSVFFLTIAAPLHLKLDGVTLAWAAEAPLLVYLGYRYRYRPVRTWAIAVLLAAALRVLTVKWPLHTEAFAPFFNRSFGSALAVAAAGAVLAVIHQRNAAESTGRDDLLKRLTAIAAGIYALLLVHEEVGSYLRLADRVYAARCAGMFVWAVGSLAYLGAGMRWRTPWSRRAGLLPLAVALLMGLMLYGEDAPEGYLLLANARFLAALLSVAALFWHGLAEHRLRDPAGEEDVPLGKALLWASALALLSLLSVEAYSWCLNLPGQAVRARWTALMSVSVVWAVYAAAILAVGFRQRIMSLRFAALGLFAATGLKLVLVDIAEVKQAYRIVSFLVLGVLMVGAAYVYNRIERQFEQREAGTEDGARDEQADA